MRKSISYYQNIINNLGSGISLQKIILDKKGKPVDFEFIEANPVFEKLTGLKGKDIIGKKASEIFPDLLNKKFDWLNFYGDVALNGKKKSHKYFSNSQKKWLQVLAHCPEKGYFVTEFQDITVGMRVEEELRLKDKVFEASIAANSIADTNGVIIQANEAFLNIWGYQNKEEVIGKPISHFIKYEEEAKEIIKSLNEKETWSGEYTAIKKDGTKFTALGLATVIRDESGQLIGYQSAVLDITDRRKTVKKLLESKEKYRLLSEYSGIGMGLYSPDGKILMFNQKALKNLGGKAEDYIGKKLTEVFGDIEGAKYERRMKLAAESETPLEFEDFVQMPDGNRWYLSTHLRILNSKGKVIGIQVMAQDITERKQAEEDLKRNEFFLKESQRIGLIGSYEYNIQSDVWTSSEVLDDIFGIERNSEKNLISWNALIHPEQKEEMLKYFKEYVFEQKHFFDKEYKIIRPGDGAVRWLWGRGELSFDGNGIPVKMIGTIQDITERKEAEEEIKRSRKEFQTYFDSGSVGLSVTAPDKKWIEVNQRLCEMLGYTKEELTGILWTEISHPDDLPNNLELFQKSLNGKIDKYELDKRFIRKDGSILYETISVVCQRNDDGSVHHFITSYIDITERKLAEKKLAESEKRFRNLYTNMAEGVCLHRLVFDENGKPVNYKIVEVNKQYEKILNIKKEDVLDKLATEAYGVDSPPYFDKYLKVVKGEKIYTFESYFPPLDKYFLISVSPWDNNGFATIFTEITMIKKAEEELIKAKEKAEELSRLKSSFLANMSHELRTPMVAILGFAELLSERLTESEDKEMAETILKGGKRLTNTLNLILELSRVEASKMEVNLNPVNISDTTSSLVKLYNQEAVRKNLKLLSDANQEVIALVDIIMFEKIVDNLLQNAIKYTSKGEVKVITGYEKTNDDEFAFIKVKDTGIGIPVKMLESIFEPFRQVSEGRSRHFEGTGLGLSITKKYTDLMNGVIEVESELGKGSVFKVKFPAGEKDLKKEKKEKIIKTILNEPLVIDKEEIFTALVVEDDEMSVDMIKFVIKDFCEYDIVPSGEKALKKVREKHYSIILMDIGLKGMSGLEAVKKIRKIPDYKDTPILAVTAYAMEGDRERFLNGGCTDYISKPFKIKDFQEIFKKYLFYF